MDLDRRARPGAQPGHLLLSDGVPVTADLIADEANVKVKAVEGALETFARKAMLHTDPEGVLVVTNWAKRQPETRGKSDGNTPEITDEFHANNPETRGKFDATLLLETDTEVPSEPPETEAEGETEQAPTTPEHRSETAAPDARRASQRGLGLALADGALDAEFKAWWSVWPKRDGKHPASVAYKKRRRAGRSAEALLSAAEHVAESIENGSSELRYTPLPASFLNDHRDEDWENGPPVPPSTPNGRNGGGSTLSRNLANLAAITPGANR
jgi:hypothetical protein